MADSELINALIAHFPTFVQRSCITIRIVYIQGLWSFCSDWKLWKEIGDRTVRMQMRLERLRSTGTSDGRSSIIKTDKLVTFSKS
jgi:hypothetical protein